MKRSIASLLLILLALLSFLPVITRPAKAQTTTTFTAQLLAANEVPPVAVHPSEANANGSVVVTLFMDAGGNFTATFDVLASGLASPIILAHIHEGGPTVNGPIRVDSNISPAAPIPISNGAASFTRTNLAVPTNIGQALLANPGGFYFNIHTSLSPGGVARGQLARQQTGPVLGAPTLSEWGMVLMALLVVAACAFFIFGRGSAAAALGASHAATLAGPAKAIDWRLLAKVTAFVEGAIALVLVIASAGAVDAMGALTAGLLVAFILHLLIGASKNR